MITDMKAMGPHMLPSLLHNSSVFIIITYTIINSKLSTPTCRKLFLYRGYSAHVKYLVLALHVHKLCTHAIFLKKIKSGKITVAYACNLIVSALHHYGLLVIKLNCKNQRMTRTYTVILNIGVPELA